MKHTGNDEVLIYYEANENIEEDTTETNLDPLDGVCNNTETQKYYRLDDTVFAEPLNQNIISNSTTDKEDFEVIDNVIVQKRAGKINRKYLFRVEDRDNPTCPQQNCGKIFSTMPLLTAHIRLVHCAENKYVCERCGSQFPTKYQLRRHTLTHEGYKTQCPVCHKMLSLRTNLQVHLRSHSDQRQHQCEVCNKRFVRKATLNIHVKFVHNKELLCDVCDQRFKSRLEWSRHMAAHKKKK